MKRLTSRLHRFEEISRRYNGPIPKHEYTRLEAVTPASIDKDKVAGVNIGVKTGQYVGVKRHQLRGDMTRAPIGALVISCGGC